jgi:Na+-translocating ferredoxin:NAD+ oxidoreductase RnfD subunit
MTRWTIPGAGLPWFASTDAVASATKTVDAITTATPMAVLKEGATSGLDLLAMLTGQTGGCIGETSALALLAGLAYLLIRKVINFRIPAAYLGSVALLTLLFPKGGDSLLWMTYQLLGGGLLLGAIFMATDYTSSPSTPGGQWVFGIGCGVLTVVIRYFGAYNEGVSFAILLMNAFVWMIDSKFRPRRYGVKRFEKLRGLVKKLPAPKPRVKPKKVKLEEPKVEEVIPEEPKTEEPKPEEPTPEDTKPEEEKPEEPMPEEPVSEDVKPEGEEEAAK